MESRLRCTQLSPHEDAGVSASMACHQRFYSRLTKPSCTDSVHATDEGHSNSG